MSWLKLTDRTRTLAENNLTPRQLNVIRDRINGHSWRTIGAAYSIDEATARGHYYRGMARLNHLLERKEPPMQLRYATVSALIAELGLDEPLVKEITIRPNGGLVTVFRTNPEGNKYVTEDGPAIEEHEFDINRP